METNHYYVKAEYTYLTQILLCLGRQKSIPDVFLPNRKGILDLLYQLSIKQVDKGGKIEDKALSLCLCKIKFMSVVFDICFLKAHIDNTHSVHT